jgi:hypothetical protein
MHSGRLVTLAAAVLALFTLAPPAQAAEFHFTATSDMRQYHSHFNDLCESINYELGGPGVFHVSIGDIDGRVWENRDVIDDTFGESAIWYPVIGNHESEDGVEMEWLRDEYDNGNGERTPLKLFTNQDGPTGTVRMNYTWDYENVHFVALNQYWDGGTNEGNGRSLNGSDTAADGDIVPELYDWLAADLAANTRPLVIVFGHEPAFPQYRHLDNSLNKYPENRDAFWQLLEDNNVVAFLNGHTHVYYKHQGNKDGVGNTWQIDLGNAGNDSEFEDGYTYGDVRVTDCEITFDIWQDKDKDGTYELIDSWTESITPPSLTCAGMERSISTSRRRTSTTTARGLLRRLRDRRR